MNQSFGLPAGFSSLTTFIAMVTILPLTIIRTYSIKAACLFRFPPMLPMCIFDDFFALMERTVVARHLPWPSGLWGSSGPIYNATNTTISFGSSHPRVQIMAHPPADCVTHGFTDGFATLAYWLQVYFGDTWRVHAPLASMQMVFGVDTVSTYSSQWLNVNLEDPILVACSWLGLVNIPLVIMVVVFSVVLITTIAQVGLVALRRVAELATFVTFE